MKVFDWIKFQGAGGPGEAADLPPPHSAEDGDGQPAATEVTILVLPTFSTYIKVISVFRIHIHHAQCCGAKTCRSRTL